MADQEDFNAYFDDFDKNQCLLDYFLFFIFLYIVA